MKHGHNSKGTKSPTYQSWDHAKSRCLNPNDNSYSKYGGRGIKFCDRWLKFENFLADMGERPPDTTLDRIDFNGNYEPGNCKWSDIYEQNRNRRKQFKARSIFKAFMSPDELKKL